MAVAPSKTAVSEAARRSPINYSRVSFVLFGLDVAGLVAALNLAYLLRFQEWFPRLVTWQTAWISGVVLLSLYIFGAHDPRQRIEGTNSSVRAVSGTVVGGVLATLIVYLFGLWGSTPLLGRGILPVALLLFIPWAVAVRMLADRWVNRSETHLRWLVLGAGERASLFFRDFSQSRPVGEVYFLAETETERAECRAPNIIGLVENAVQLDLGRYSGILVAMQPPLSDALVQRLMEVRFTGCKVYDLADFYESQWYKVPILHLRSGWFVFSHGFDLLHNPIGLHFKRVIDLFSALLLTVVLAPILMVIAGAVRLDSEGPAVFRQRRKGENGRIFTMYKFRTMRRDECGNGSKWTTVDDIRITRIGRILRRYRLDELPQLINIIRGDMSFIGPRPEALELSEVFEREIPFYDLRYVVKPGITGWAQVMYSYGSSVEDAREKLQYDLYYIKNYSVLLDIAIVLKTLRVVILGRGR